MKKFFYLLSAFTLSFLPLCAQEGNGASPKRGFSQTFIMIGIAILFFYFIMWRPEQRRRKKLEKSRSSLQKGDRVTAMGIVGYVSRVLDDTVILKMVDGSKIEFLKGAVTEVHSPSEEESKKVELNPGKEETE